ncbi:hypothetical protein DdX_21490 [Ditylenchus destructor]|uniref:Alpha-type protein kinase domain-containing protein n=1 Tax=Ditylenchus destructor TaxID=166010 RepID=A0AAD4QVN2_9BILA|nr:hypothetical protein DdX_21490 [Ditylenchus destructor]
MVSIEIKPGVDRYMSCERRYGNDSKFLRFSNNADYAMLESTCKVHDLTFDVVELLMAFSHWTYQAHLKKASERHRNNCHPTTATPTSATFNFSFRLLSNDSVKKEIGPRAADG